jgi:hypothetical protein
MSDIIWSFWKHFDDFIFIFRIAWKLPVAIFLILKLLLKIEQ